MIQINVKTLIIFVLLFNFSLDVQGGSKPFSVMTYNVHGIPCMKKGIYKNLLRHFNMERCPDNTYYSQTIDGRMKTLENILKDLEKTDELPDVLLLQEAFLGSLFLVDDKAMISLIKNSPYPYYALGPRPTIKNNIFGLLSLLFKRDGLVDSGLVILSKNPITMKQRRAFKVCGGTDCLANKGVAYARVQVDGVPHDIDIDIFSTHMQAGQSWDSMRFDQNDVLSDFLQDNERSVWTIVGGDFNFRNQKRYPSYQDYVNKSVTNHVGLECVKSKKCVAAPGTKNGWLRGDLLDHQFTATKGKKVSIEPTYVEYNHFGYMNRPLSDHRFMLVEYLLSW